LRQHLRPIKQLLFQDEHLEQDWEQFVYHFDQVHSGFFRRLREQYPQLTPKDHRLCAYLRMNLTTKEIAPLLNISVRGVEIGRYRLRRKMGLGNDVNLNEYMMNF
jgi:DNA-binding CsgD family transcriptional regulator